MNATYKHGSATGSIEVEEIDMGPDQRAEFGWDGHVPATPPGPSSAGVPSEEPPGKSRGTDPDGDAPLAALARLAAGVAHEIDHPSEVLRANAETTETYLLVMVKLVREYEGLVTAVTESDKPAAGEHLRRIGQLREAEDVGFILDDLRSLLRESRESAARLRGLAGRLTALSREEALPRGAGLTTRVDEAVHPRRAA